eukprot:1248858-Amorphochlora_amoeboformis.AAC.2
MVACSRSQSGFLRLLPLAMLLGSQARHLPSKEREGLKARVENFTGKDTEGWGPEDEWMSDRRLGSGWKESG